MAVYPLDGGSGYVIASGGRWLPGVYATVQAARWAFQFSDEDLIKLRNSHSGEPITTAHLREYRKGSSPT
jgi:hypothetical protein